MLRSVSTRITGLAIVVLAIWGGIIPFVGPSFHFTLGPDSTWTWTTARLYLSVLPAAGALAGGLLLLGAGPWAAGRFGALLALLSGVWFAVGPQLSTLWQTGTAEGAAHGTVTVQAMERLGLHTGLGVAIAALGAFALPGLIAGYRARRDAAVAETATAGGTTEAAAPAAPATTAPTTAATPGRGQITGRPIAPAGDGPTEGEPGTTPTATAPPERVGS